MTNSSKFNLDELRLDHMGDEQFLTDPALEHVRLRKPDRQAFIRTNLAPDYMARLNLLELKESRETYLLARDLWTEYADELTPADLFTAIDSLGTVFLWPIKVGDPLKPNTWLQSARECAKIGGERWIRVVSDQKAGAYCAHEARGALGEPRWPDKTFQELINLAFRDRMIDDHNDDVLRRLRGEAL